MEYLVNGEQSRLIDTYSIEKTGIPSLVLMERASLCVAEEIEKRLGDAGDEDNKSRKIVAVCGSGNNGGDGIAAARILFSRGYDASVLLTGDENKLSHDAARQLEIAGNMGLKIYSAEDIIGESSAFEGSFEKIALFLNEYDYILDAIFGTGLSRDISGAAAEWIRAINMAGENGSTVCGVDIASGVDSRYGQILGIAVKADFSVTFGYKKTGMILYPGAACSGEVICRDIGFDKNGLSQFQDKCISFDKSDLAGLPRRTPDSNKGTYGKVLVIAGSRNMAGAAYLSAKAAYLTGAGLVYIYTPECNRVILQQLIPEAVMKCYDEESFSQDELKELLDSCGPVVLGPGLGRSETSERIVEYVVRNAKKELIVDADGINILSENIQWLNDAKAEIALTPHLKELSRLTGHNIQTLAAKRMNICADFSYKNSVICISKDARTIITAKGEMTYINCSGNNGMSTGGSGDVLTGIIAGLAAQGAPLLDASRLGVYVHGLAGDKAAAEKSVYSLCAGDILAAIPGVLRV